MAFFLCCALLANSAIPALADPVVKDVASGDADSYLYGGNENEFLIYVSTATGDVNGDGLPDLVMGHDRGGDNFPYFYTGKVYVFLGRTDLDPEVDLGAEADLVINGYYGSFLGNSVACGDINGDGIDDILMGAMWDNPGGAMFSGGVAAVLGRADLPSLSPWDFNSNPPDLYFSSASSGEMCGVSVISGDIDGDGYDDVLFGAHLGNGGMHFYDGINWIAQGRANQDFIHDLHMIDATHGWAVGRYISAYDTIYRFNGNIWEADSLFHRYKVDLNGVTATDTSHAWAVGAGGTVLFNGDFNDTKGWTAQSSGVSSTLLDVDALDSARVWAVGDGGTIIHTTDGGDSWQAQNSGVTVKLRGISVLASDNAWAVGDGGTILHFDGSSWSQVKPSPTTRDLHSVHALDGSHVWAVGDGGTILFFDGSSWQSQASPVTTNLRGICASGIGSAWAVGESGTVLRTTDGGATWTQQAVTFTQDQKAVQALDPSQVWMAGDAATGRAYIVWGRSTWPSWEYPTNPIRPNKVINGVDPLDQTGYPVSLGDLNGDGRADILVGAMDADGPDDSRQGCGEAYVIYGRTKGSLPYFIDLASYSDCTIIGGSPMDGLPSSMCQPLKSLNGDRYDDIVLGVMWGDGPGDSRPGCGEVVVVFGGALPPILDLSHNPPYITVYGPEQNVGAGYSVEVLDFNADLLPELAVGSTSASKGTERPNCGAVWLVHGTSSWPAQVDLATSAAMTIYGAERDAAFGFCISSANLNGDPVGYEDLVISDPMGGGPGNTRLRCGEHFVFLGYDDMPPTCSIGNVADGAVLAGKVSVDVDAYDYHGIDRAEFRVNGTLRHVDNTAPYSWEWDTRKEWEGGGYRLQVTAYDIHGNQASDSRQLSINNTIPSLSRTWYLAEGTTAWGFEEYVLIQNPNPEEVRATVTFMKPGGAFQTESFKVGPESRFTLFVNAFVAESDVSTRVEASLPVICERAMYWKGRDGGHASIGVTLPSKIWYLAEGTTAWGFEEYVLV
ncbi:MAG: YCF48-related protein, partial [Actinomycetota bacterium]